MTTEPLHRRKQHHFRHLDCRLNRFVFFLTLCTNAKKAFFSNAKVCEIIVSELEHRRLIREIKLFCYCLLPDHLHLLISFDEMYLKKTGAFGERALQNWVSAFKRYTSRMAGQTCGVKPLWQGNFYDHVVRDDESLLEICQYILNNPVRKGLASRWQEYPYSKIVDSLPL